MNFLADKKDGESVRPRYRPGTVVHSKVDPAVELAVIRYSDGIYYCAVIGNAQYNNLPFLECQLEAGI